MAEDLDTGSLGALRAQDAELAHLLTLCMPAAARPAAQALFSLHLELARAHRVTSDTTIGTIRIRWWLDAVDNLYANKAPRQHPIVLSLASAVATHGLARGLIDAKIESHALDLDGLRPLIWAEASQLFASQRGNLFRLILQAQGIEHAQAHAAANHLGVAMGVWRAIPGIGTINDLPWLSEAPTEPNWLVQALTHLDEIDGFAKQATLPKWLRVYGQYLRAGLIAVANDRLPQAYAQQKSAAFGLWRRMLF